MKSPLPPAPASATRHLPRPASVLLGALLTLALAAGTRAQKQDAAAAARAEAVTLSPFEVVGDASDSYQALNTSSLSGTNRPLERLPITAEIFNAQMMSDLGTADVTTLLTKHFTGIGLPDNGTSNATGLQSGDALSMGAFTARGLGTKLYRNGFLFLGNLGEGYSYERMEVIRGPQSLLFGISPAGAIMNASTKRATFGQTKGSLMFRADGNDSVRTEIDGNLGGTLAKRRFALRLAAFGANTRFWRDFIHAEGDGVYAQLAAELLPASQTALRVTFEDRTMVSVQPKLQNLVTGIPTLVPNNTPLAVLLGTQSPALAQIANGQVTWESVDSLAGNSQYQHRRERFDEIVLTSRLSRWLHAQLQAYRAYAYNDSASPNSFQTLRPPLTLTNPLNAWAVGYIPSGLRNESWTYGTRGLLTADFQVTSKLRNQLVINVEKTTNPYSVSQNYKYYQVDANGSFLRNPAQLNTTDGGRTPMGVQWVDVFANRAGYTVPRLDRYTVNGVTYVRDWIKYPNPAFATPANPLGYNGGLGSASTQQSQTEAQAAVLYTDWFGDRVSSVVGLRRDNFVLNQLHTGLRATGLGTTGNAGLVWKATEAVSIYAGASSNFTPASSTFALLWNGQPPPDGKGESIEAGLKLNAFEGRLSGSITAYETRAINLSTALSAEVRAATDPAGINGRWYATFNSPVYTYDRTTKGLEVTLTARPTRNWRTMWGASVSKGVEASSVVLPFLYNDEFRANAQGQVLLSDGTPLLVPVNPATRIATDGKTYPAGTATQVLTVGMLKSGDAGGNYRAQLAADSGGILNAAALGLTVPGVGTGRVGLPISQHQLGFVPVLPGIEVRKGGDITSGFPRFSYTATSMYTFSQSRLKGLSLGLNGRADLKLLRYYYNNAAKGNLRTPYYWKDQVVLNAIVGYDVPLLRRWKWRTQLNLNNVFDQRSVELAPNIATGVIDNALLRNDPRTWVWTNTISF